MTAPHAGRAIRAVSFDADGTLWDFARAMRRSLAETLAELRRLRPGAATAALSVERLIAVRDEVAERLYGLGATMEEIRLAAFAATLERLGTPDPALAAHLTAFYLERRFAGIELYPDAAPALARLRGAYRLGLLSNGNTYPERCGLAGYFAFVAFAQDHGARKPAPAFYRAALRRAGVTPTTLVHVGDSLDGDVAGAQAAGIRAVWLNRHGRPNTTGVRPDAEIASLSELDRALRDLGERPGG